MRVIAGFLGGRVFESPHGHRTHPMAEKTRGAIFGALGDIKGLEALDAFAGSGAIGIEAISRGAKSVVAVEVDKGAHTIITSNVESLGITDRLKVIRAYVNAWSTRHQAQLFDIIFADPPYEPFDKIPFRDLRSLPRHLKEDGVLVLSWPGKFDPYAFEGLKEVLIKNHGDAQIIFYKRA